MSSAIKDFQSTLSTLRKKGNKENAKWEWNYMKTKYTCYGVKAKDTVNAVKDFHKNHKDISKKELQNILDICWTSDSHTEKIFAIKLLGFNKDYLYLFSKKDLNYFKGWLRLSDGWCHTDFICGYIIAPLLLKDKAISKDIDKWITDKHLWVRRSTLIAYIPTIRKTNKFLPNIFTNCKKLAEEKDFFIRKAIGWVLRETSKKYPKEVIKFVKDNEKILSNLSKREALRVIK